jgi:hypothetical protein
VRERERIFVCVCICVLGATDISAIDVAPGWVGVWVYSALFGVIDREAKGTNNKKRKSNIRLKREREIEKKMRKRDKKEDEDR